MQKAYQKNAKHISIPGFRKGKVPRKMIEKYYGEAVFYEDAINFVCPDAYEAAVKAALAEYERASRVIDDIKSYTENFIFIIVNVYP